MSRNDLVGQGVRFERYGRITGYAARIDRWNDAKKNEKKERVTHSVGSCCSSS